MARVETQKTSTDSIKASLNYLVDTGEKPVTYTAKPGSSPEQRSGRYEGHTVTIQDGRPMIDDFSLEREGFVFVNHETKVKDFYNEDELRSVYYPEMERLVKDMTGAARVLIFDHTLRAEDNATREEKKVREPVRRVHNDYTEWSGPQRVRDLLPADEAEKLLQHRFAVIQVWRPIRNPACRRLSHLHSGQVGPGRPGGHRSDGAWFRKIHGVAAKRRRSLRTDLS